MLNFSMPELGVILVIALVVFGPGKLPEIGSALGKTIGEVRKGLTCNDDIKEAPINIQAKSVEKDTQVQPSMKKPE